MLNKAIFSAFFDTNTNNANSKLNNQNRLNSNRILNLTTSQHLQNELNNQQLNSLNETTTANYLICNHYLYIDNFFDNSIDIYNAFIIHKIIVSIICLLLGMFFILVGYRFLKMSTFLTGFTMGTLIIYFILNEHRLLNFYENLIIAVSIGVLFALVSLLVQYIGIFLLGVTSSSILICFVLVIIDLFYKNKSIWLCISLLFFCAIILASLTLKFQKSMSILNTSCIGAALFTSGIDYFIEKNYLIDHMYDLLKVNSKYVNNEDAASASNSKMFEIQSKLVNSISSNNSTSNNNNSSSIILTRIRTTTLIQQTNINSPPLSIFTSLNLIAKNIYDSTSLCWYSWFIFSGFFLLFIVGVLMQALITGRNYDHRDSWHQLIRNRRKAKSANLEKIRRKSHFPASDYHDEHEIQSDDHTEHSTGTNCSVTNITRLPVSSTSGSLNSSRNHHVKNSPKPMLKLMKTSGGKTKAKTASALSPIAIAADDLPVNSNKKTKLVSLNHTPSNKSLSPLLNLKSTANNKNLIKQQISSKDNTEKFRYFYQIRRNNGDVLSNDFLNNLQKQSKEREEGKTQIERNITNASPQSTSSSSTNCNVHHKMNKLNKNCSKKSTNSNSSVSTTTTITRVI